MGQDATSIPQEEVGDDAARGYELKYGCEILSVCQMTEGMVLVCVVDQVQYVTSSASGSVGFHFRQVAEVVVDGQIARALAEVLRRNQRSMSEVMCKEAQNLRSSIARLAQVRVTVTSVM